MINITRGENITSISKINSAQISNTSNATQTYYNGGKEGVDYRFLEYGINYDITEPILLNDIAPRYLKDESGNVLEYDDLESLMDIAIPTDIEEGDDTGLKFFGSYRIGQRYLYVFHLLSGDNIIKLFSDTNDPLLTLEITNSPDEKIVENEKIVYLAFSMDSEQVEGTVRVAYNAWTRLVNPVRHKFSLALRSSDINTEPDHIEKDQVSNFWFDGSGNIYGTREIENTRLLDERKNAYGGAEFYSPWKAYKSGDVVKKKLVRKENGVSSARFQVSPGKVEITSNEYIRELNINGATRECMKKYYSFEATEETELTVIALDSKKSDFIVISVDPNLYISLKDDNINHPISSISPWWTKMDNLGNYYTRVIILKCDHGELEKTRFNFLSGTTSVNTKLTPNLGYEPIMEGEGQDEGIVVTKNMIQPGPPDDTYYNIELTPNSNDDVYTVKMEKVRSGISFKFNKWQKSEYSWNGSISNEEFPIDDNDFVINPEIGLDSGIQVNIIDKEVEISGLSGSAASELKEYLSRLTYSLDGYTGEISYDQSTGEATILPPYEFTQPVYNFSYSKVFLSVLVANAGDWEVDKQYSDNIAYGSGYEVKVYYGKEGEIDHTPQICFNKDFSHWHDMIPGPIELNQEEMPTFAKATIQKEGKLYTITLEGITKDTKIDIK